VRASLLRAWTICPLFSLLVAPLVGVFLFILSLDLLTIGRDDSSFDKRLAVLLFFAPVAYLPALMWVGPQALLAGCIATACSLRWRRASRRSRQLRIGLVGVALGALSAAVIPWVETFWSDYKRGGWLLDPLMLCIGAATGCFVALRVSKLVTGKSSP